MARPHALPVADATPGGPGRRRVLRGLLTGVGAGVAAPALAGTHLLGEHAHHPARIASARAKAADVDAAPALLDGYQMKMLESLGEAIVPGSTDAGCARFIDSLLAVGEPRDARLVLSALGAIDAEARRRHSRPWLDLTASEQVVLLEAAASGPEGHPEPDTSSARAEDRLADESWTPGTSVADYLARQASRAQPYTVTLRDHFDLIKRWVLGAYYTSEAGQRELGVTGPTFADQFPACTHEGGHRQS